MIQQFVCHIVVFGIRQRYQSDSIRKFIKDGDAADCLAEDFSVGTFYPTL